jgi:hypothetical protein
MSGCGSTSVSALSNNGNGGGGVGVDAISPFSSFMESESFADLEVGSDEEPDAKLCAMGMDLFAELETPHGTNYTSCKKLSFV